MCKKTKYISRVVAKKRMAEIQSERWHREKTPIRVYECKECGFFHMTSRPMGEYANNTETMTNEPRTKTKPHLQRQRPRYTEGYAQWGD